MIYVVIAETKLASGFAVELCKEMDAEPEHYELHIKHPTGVIKVGKEANNMVDALVFHSQAVEEFI